MCGAAQDGANVPLGLADGAGTFAAPPFNETKIHRNGRQGAALQSAHQAEPRRIHPSSGEDFQRLILPHLHAVVSELV